MRRAFRRTLPAAKKCGSAVVCAEALCQSPAGTPDESPARKCGEKPRIEEESLQGRHSAKAKSAAIKAAPLREATSYKPQATSHQPTYATPSPAIHRAVAFFGKISR